MSQSVQAVRFSEQRALKLNTRQRALLREVTLFVNGTAWVYARTIIPLGTLKGKLRYLQHLGNRPLGEQLFVNPTMQREAMMFATVANAHLPAELKHSKPLGGRRTLFKLNNKPLLVCEIFLAAIYDEALRL
jgi:chorismate--pyruvate lyase